MKKTMYLFSFIFLLFCFSPQVLAKEIIMDSDMGRASTIWKELTSIEKDDIELTENDYENFLKEYPLTNAIWMSGKYHRMTITLTPSGELKISPSYASGYIFQIGYPKVNGFDPGNPFVEYPNRLESNLYDLKYSRLGSILQNFYLNGYGIKMTNATVSKLVKKVSFTETEKSAFNRAQFLFANLPNLVEIDDDSFQAVIKGTNERYKNDPGGTELPFRAPIMTGMFYNTPKLKKISFRNAQFFINDSPGNIQEAVFDDEGNRLLTYNDILLGSSIEHLDLRNTKIADYRAVSNLNIPKDMFTSQNYMSFKFSGNKSLRTIDLSGADMTFNNTLVGKLNKPETYKKIDSYFGNMPALESINLTGANFSNKESMTNLFYNTPNLKEVKLDQSNTSNLTEISGMFYKSGIVEADLSPLSLKEDMEMINLFKETPRLEKVTFGDDARFKKDNNQSVQLGIPVFTEKFGVATGNWTKNDGSITGYSPAELVQNFGEGELSGGTYIAEYYTQSDADVSLYFNGKAYNAEQPPQLSIGDKLDTSITIAHSKKSGEGSTLVNPKLTLGGNGTSDLANALNNLYVKGTKNGKVPAKLITYQGNSVEKTEDIEDITNLTLEDLPYDKTYELQITGNVWNNTNSELDIFSANLTGTTKKYNSTNTDVSPLNKVDEGKVNVANGSLTFSLQETLIFKDTLRRPSQLDNATISRKDNSFNIAISDYRGTNPSIPNGTDAARVNWRMEVTASKFINLDTNQEIPYDDMKLVYKVNPISEAQPISDTAMELINRDVSQEQPIDDHTSTIQWENKEGFKLYTRSASRLPLGSYQSEVIFDLKVAP